MKNQSLELLEMWQDAIALKNARKWREAVEILEDILRQRPDWEHGYGHFNLAECYEEVGRNGEAEAAYRMAVVLDPTDSTLLGGLASFLYLHGPPAAAFDVHVCLLCLEQRHGNTAGAASTTTALKALGVRLGWSASETARRITSQTEGSIRRGRAKDVRS